MILQGNQRGGAKNLALHLLKEENEHVEVHELRGFVSDNLVSALNEVYAVSRATKAKQFLFSLSLNPPPAERVSTEAFESAIGRVEEKLGLSGQPRAIIFHEKEGRRHCHAVWSRIDTAAMKAIPLSFSKRKLGDVSRELFREHGWQMPQGLIRRDEFNTRNFTLEQWQQAKRNGKDPRAIKQVMQDCWAASDSQAAFRQALRSNGYILARGDRRGFVAVDYRGEVYSVSKWVGVKAKDVRAKLADNVSLPSVNEAKAEISREVSGRLVELQDQQNAAYQGRLTDLTVEREQMTRKHADERRALRRAQQERWKQETLARQERFNKGLRGWLDRLTGKHRRIKEQNQLDMAEAQLRDRREKDALIFRQLGERRPLQDRIERLRKLHHGQRENLSADMERFMDMSRTRHRLSRNDRSRDATRTPTRDL